MVMACRAGMVQIYVWYWYSVGLFSGMELLWRRRDMDIALARRWNGSGMCMV